MNLSLLVHLDEGLDTVQLNTSVLTDDRTLADPTSSDGRKNPGTRRNHQRSSASSAELTDAGAAIRPACRGQTRQEVAEGRTTRSPVLTPIARQGAD
ncbi:hypothetical protein, partial [Mycobacterium sp.]|uniref:hypothetical protein n=1 Tax=Mycobacterium sp. TaxID=1785 RepID=UPI003C78D861